MILIILPCPSSVDVYHFTHKVTKRFGLLTIRNAGPTARLGTFHAATALAKRIASFVGIFSANAPRVRREKHRLLQWYQPH